MNKSFNLCLLLLCLLYSMAQASPPSKNDFDFLEPFNNTALVENGLELTGSIAGVSLSTLLNLGIWWGVCKTAGIVSGLSSANDLAASDTKELETLKTDFCLQLAPVITTAEVVLAGRVSPWPLEQRWWKPLYFVGAGMAAYAASTKTWELIPVAVLTYFASEAVSGTGGSAFSAFILRKMNVSDIKAEWYAAGEYAILSVINGVVMGSVTYETMIQKGFGSAKATLASVVSAAVAGSLSGIVSASTIHEDGQTRVGAGVITVVEAGAIAGAGSGAAAAAGFGAGVGAGGKALVRALAFARAGVGAVVSAGAAAGIGVGAAAGIGVGVGVAALSRVGALFLFGSSKITSNNPLIKAGFTLVPALTFALINSLSNYAVYGHPLEQSFSETGSTQWKKFYAPLDYLSTLFK